MRQIDKIHLACPFYGSRKIRNELWATAETGCGMTINQEHFTTYKTMSPVLRTQTTHL